MKNAELVLGGPGAGKTFCLLNKINQYLNSGGAPERIGFVSFTKKAVNEARDRASAKFSLPVSRFPYFRTIHSLCFHQLNMSRGEVMNRHHYKELGDAVGMKISGIHRQDQMVYEMPEGDQLCFLEALSRAMCQPLRETWESVKSDLEFAKLDFYQRSLDAFKRAKLLYDFTDMLTKFVTEGTAPQLEVLFVDEAQDLCKLQWNIVDKLSANSERTIIAGDDDQAIFRWSGADIDYFIGLAQTYETETLTQSYRLPKPVFDASQNLIQNVTHRNHKVFLPTEKAGNVEHVCGLEDINMDIGTWLLLTRNGYTQERIIKHLRQMGLPYLTNYYNTNEDDILLAAKIWETLRQGKTATAKEVDLALSYIEESKNSKEKSETFTMADLVASKRVMDKKAKEIWHVALDRIPGEDREYYIAARRRGEALNKAPRIKVSTIHGAKGGEADHVVVFTDISLRTYNAMQENIEDEYRVFYVAVTRAKKSLYIVEPQTNNYFLL